MGQDMADGPGGLGFWSFRRLFSLIEEESRWGDICLIELVHQMVSQETVAGIILAEILLSLGQCL